LLSALEQLNRELDRLIQGMQGKRSEPPGEGGKPQE
jgi:hypothetical protein